MKTKIIEYIEYDKQGTPIGTPEYFIRYKKKYMLRWNAVRWYLRIPEIDDSIAYLTRFPSIELAQNYIDEILIKNKGKLISKKEVRRGEI